MKKLWLLSFVLCGLSSYAQKVTLNPTVTPALFKYNTPITVTYDVTGTSLANLTDAWIWVWIPGSNINAKYNTNPAGGSSALPQAKFTKSTSNGKTLFTLTFTPSDFFTSDISTQKQIGMLLKGNDWSNGQTSDYVATFWDGSFQLKLTSPTQRPLFVKTNDQIQIAAETPVAANYSLYINNVLTDQKNSVINYSYNHTVTESTGYSVVKLVASLDANSSETSFQYILSVNSPVLKRPAGIISGINYSADPSKVTLCLLAPGKTSVYALGDFSNWDVLPQNIMYQDGEYFWIELSGLTPGLEYAFQYLVNESIFVADPYADKILDPDDSYISATTYPGLKIFPEKAKHADWYFNRLSVFQTNQQAYNWVIQNFTKPKKEKMVVYELLIRDFFGNGSRNYQNLIDTIYYFKRLGVNAIELMPIMEFNGNESWGYNPTFMFAPDKYYGTKNKFKEFIDVCHKNGIAVILDIAMNHQDIPNPYVLMDFDFSNYKPTINNKWFNTDAKHPFNVFYDMNHESLYTKAYLDTINYYWLNEYKVDGFRFDLSKGFTQTNNPNDVNKWSDYDASRIAILERMADKIWEHTPDAYIILEHLGVNSEEKVLAEYRSAEGKGMMLWGKMTDPYNQNTMGYETNSDITWVLHTTRGWSIPHVVGYMESHDEERLMFKNLAYGNASPTYSARTLNISLDRMKAANLIFYTLPGPKMLWQFGELGYDVSIDFDGRISPKPVRWEYLNDVNRKRLLQHTSEVIKLRNTYPVFTKGTATITGGTSLVKQIMLKGNPFTSTPTNADQMNVQIAVNLDIIPKEVSINFSHTGTWYDFYRGGTPVNVTGASITVTMEPGSYKLYTDFPIQPSVITEVEKSIEESMIAIYPVPVKESLIIKIEGQKVLGANVYSLKGEKITLAGKDDEAWSTEQLVRGLYIIEVQTEAGVIRKRIVKE